MRLALPAWAGASLLAALAAVPPARAQDGTWALTNVRIETVTRGVIEHGTIVVRDGLIQAVGADVVPPPDARVVDLSGRTVYPGLIDLISSLGLAAAQAPAAGRGGPAAAAAPAEGTPVGLEPDRMVADEIRPAAADVKTLRDGGITAVLVAPTRGAFRGLSALVPMRDSLTTRAIIRSPVAENLGFEGVAGRYPGTLLGVIAYQRQAFYDARRQAQLLDRYRANPRGMERPPYDEHLAALIPVVKGDLPAFFFAKSEDEIRRAVNIGREFGLKLTVVGATEAFRATDALRAMGPVVVSVDFPKSPDVTGWAYHGTVRHAPGDSAAADSAARPVIEGNAAALNTAGIRFALSSGGALRPAEFLGNVRKAIAAGLPRDVALEALTIRPAEIAGVAEQLGSIEPGKIANLVVAEGDLLGDSAKVRAVFVDGARYEVIAPAPAPAGRGRGGAAAAEPAAEVGGTWDVTVTTPQGSNQATMTVTQSGATITGQMTSELGSAALDNGQVTGRAVSWSITLQMGGQSMTIPFHGDVEGNQMRGTAELPGMGSASFTAQKRNP
jgi:imidazolonepropionase-like amidohydrolase